MNEALFILIPIVVSFLLSLVVPNLILRSITKQQELDKQELRKDAEKVRVDALAAARRVEKKADAVASDLRKSTTATNDKLDVIHTLVNSNMTRQMQATLTALQAQKVALEGGKQTAAAKKVINGLKVRIADLEKVLKQRDRTAAIIDRQAAKKKPSAKKNPAKRRPRKS